jgi:hypothetical protein
MAIDSLASRLESLLRDGSIEASWLRPRMRRQLETLFHVGALGEVKVGAGRRVIVRDRAALQAWIESQYPSGLGGIEGTFSPRAEAVANYRDSKRGRPLEACLVHMRGFGDAALSRGTQRLPLAQMTREFDVVGVAIKPQQHWSFSGMLVVVENLEVFLRIEQLPIQVDAALWAAGRLNERIIDWFGSQPDLRVLHIGDYDPVGLDDYLRLRRALQDRVVLYVPGDLEVRVARFGNKNLLHDSSAVLERLRREADESAARVIEILDRYGLGLEQEGLLVPVEAGGL